jgi:hypothetical protein
MKIDYTLVDTEIDNLILQRGGSMLFVLINGGFRIDFDEIVFFDDSDMNLLELATSLYKWVHITCMKNDYHFNCIDNEEPIFVFSDIGNKNWAIDSIWKKCDIMNVSEKELKEEIDKFVNSLDAVLQTKYGIQTSKFVDYVA